jgi:hypothetical protein
MGNNGLYNGRNDARKRPARKNGRSYNARKDARKRPARKSV